jgi:hypothetical protein
VKAEKLVEACTTQLEEKALAWALIDSMTPGRVLDVIQAYACEHMSNAEIFRLASDMRNTLASLDHMLAQETEAGR